MKSKGIRRWIIIVSLISILIMQGIFIHTFGMENKYSMPETERKLSLTVETWEIHNGKKTKPVPGIKSEIYMVADFDVDSGGVKYIVKYPYREIKDSLEGITASESFEIAKDYSRVADNPVYCTVSLDDGMAKIDDIEAGMYLVIPECSKGRIISPYLISVPNYEMIDGGKWVYDVRTFPKAGIEAEPKRKEKPVDKKIKTGDEGDPEFLVLMIGISLMGIVALSISRRREER